MKKITWINFLHFYQPFFQSLDNLKKISKQSYNFIYQTLEKNPQANFTINFNGSLTELLVKNKLYQLIKNFKKLADKNQIEFVETAKYHPILPLLPKNEIERQIKLNNKINRAYFGSNYSPKGFFCPEAAYSKKAGEVVKKLGYQYLVLDEISYSGKLDLADPQYKYVDNSTHLETVFRNRKISKAYPPDIIAKKIEEQEDGNEIIITATDAEMYGFYHKDAHQNLKRVLKNKNIETKTIAQFLHGLKKKKEINLINSCWENTEKDILEKNFYGIWKDPKNPIQTKLWGLACLAIDLNQKYNSNQKYPWARKHLDRGLSSCSWWWASQKKLDVFAPISWNPDNIEKGANELIKSIRSLDAISLKEMSKSENIYSKLIKIIWDIHWKTMKRQ